MIHDAFLRMLAIDPRDYDDFLYRVPADAKERALQDAIRTLEDLVNVFELNIENAFARLDRKIAAVTALLAAIESDQAIFFSPAAIEERQLEKEFNMWKERNRSKLEGKYGKRWETVVSAAAIRVYGSQWKKIILEKE